MTYWHMQLHPDEKNWGREKELLETKSLIGLGDWDKGEPQVSSFEKEMQVGDIVLIRYGSQPIALVEVESDMIDEGDDNHNKLAWFRYRRKVKVLDYASENSHDFPQPRGTLQRLVNQNTPSYKYIENWYLFLQQKRYKPESLMPDDYKISTIFINDFKMFKNFTLNLVGTDNKPLPLIVLAGKNGTGKTSILEYLSDYNLNEGDCIEIFKTKKAEGLAAYFMYGEIFVESFKLFKSMTGILEKKSEYINHIVYLPVQVGDTGNVEEKIAEHYKKKAKEYDSFKKSLVELQTFMDTIFKDLELTFRISDVDDDKKKVFFKNANGEIFGAEALSTGEKTLLSKVLYLYFSELKNKIILIDEPELSLHPAWQNRVLKLYENFAIKNNCQIIIATHSPHIIGSAKNEYIKVLRKNANGQLEVIDGLKAHGRDINSILFDAMGEVQYRPEEFRKKIDRLYYAIEEEKDFEKSQRLLRELEKDYGENDSVIIEAKMLIEMIQDEQ